MAPPTGGVSPGPVAYPLKSARYFHAEHAWHEPCVARSREAFLWAHVIGSEWFSPCCWPCSTGGFADVEFVFDGKTLTLLGKTANLYGQLEVPGTLDHLIDELRDKYRRPAPGTDLLLSNVNDKLMATVVNVKDLESGVIGGVECDHLAFRTKDVDWQIWIAQGSRPYPCGSADWFLQTQCTLLY